MTLVHSAARRRHDSKVRSPLGRERDGILLRLFFGLRHPPLVFAYAQHGPGLERPLPEHGNALAVHEDAVLVVAGAGEEVALELGEKTIHARDEEFPVPFQRRGRHVAHEKVVALRLELGVQHLETVTVVGLSGRACGRETERFP